ncbi:hypothetical protein AB0J86_37160 [Micromonospora sp. NPDC049559]|uniref:hypothetical protein n=1 Tax=Micromonospora sp. NPDC049559 TaxID=3155923 RepID=UPI00344593EA
MATAAGPITETRYSARRFSISTDTPFEEFRLRYETAVPAYDAVAFGALAKRGADWSEVLALTERVAPYGFLRYAEIDAQPLMGLAGDRARCVEYLMGNHTIAERMFRHDPVVLLYVPLRTTISAAEGGPTRFSVEQPSEPIASLGQAEIAAVGIELDRKLVHLLQQLELAVPPVLVAST